MARNSILWLEHSPKFFHRNFSTSLPYSQFNSDEYKAIEIVTYLVFLFITFIKPSYVSDLLKSDQHEVMTHGQQHRCQSLC